MENKTLQNSTFIPEILSSLKKQVPKVRVLLNSKPYLCFELVAIFAGLPLLFFFGLVPLPELLTLVIITAVLSIWLFGFGRANKYHFRLPVRKQTLRHILIRFVFAATVLTGIILLLEPQYFLSLVLENPLRWTLIILLYPILSVLPQEIIYRVFFFKRYGTLFTNKYLMIHVNALAFGFLHIIYGNFTAVFLTYATGYVFARTYHFTRSFWAVCIEHTIYGIFLFTIGMGHYFVNGG
ncbi:MAG: CPBP family intramembrane metalloprotease [Balneolales bacterium]|nr:CPBP family intramembrane metalloprotease [Balneolales bacterium]